MGMPEKEKKILEDVKYFEDKYFTFDEPVPFCGMYLHPVGVKHYNEFLSCSSCLTLNKNDDPMGIAKTHLDYLIGKMKDEKEGPAWSFKFSHLLELVFNIENGLYCEDCGKTISYDEVYRRTSEARTEDEALNSLKCDCGSAKMLTEVIKYAKDPDTKKTILKVKGHTLTTDDFQKFRRYVMYQNLPDFKDDSWVNKELRDDQALKQEILSRNSGTATLERKIVCIAAKSNYKIEEIQKMTMRKMIMLLEVIQESIDYQINKTGLMSGFVSLKKGETIDHWIYKKDHGLYGKAVDAGELKAQIQSAGS